MIFEKRYTFEQYRDASHIILESIIEPSAKLPNSKYKLFKNDNTLKNYNVSLDRYNKDKLYLDGYLKSAKILSHVTYYSDYDFESMIYPIAYMYRHYLELKLKAIIYIGSQIEEDNNIIEKEEILKEHGLMPLWHIFKTYFDKISGHNDDFQKVKKGMESLINQIHEVDKQSMSFRYSKDLNENDSLKNLKEINFAKFCENIEKLTDLLEAIGNEFEEALSFVNENRYEAMNSNYDY